MSAKEEVLDILQENMGTPVSGEEIARLLSVSRNTVWKAVNSLKEEGYEIEAATNRGYILISESDVLSNAGIHKHLDAEWSHLVVDVRDTVSSTNTVLKGIAEQGGREGMVLIAQQQTAGKGRLGRSFYSPVGTGLYMIILLRPKFDAEQSLFITTAAAAAVSEAVEEVSGRPAQIKWVNDVYQRGKKICGILTEASIDFESKRLSYAVLGIGVNIREPEDGFSEELREIVGTVWPAEPPKGARTRLAASILNHFFNYYQRLDEKAFLDEYRKRSLLTGMEITFSHGNREEHGTVLGIDDNAGLIVRLRGGQTKVFSSGEVSINKDFLKALSEKEQERNSNREN